MPQVKRFRFLGAVVGKRILVDIPRIDEDRAEDWPADLGNAVLQGGAVIVLIIDVDAGDQLMPQESGIELGDRRRDVLGTVGRLREAGRAAWRVIHIEVSGIHRVAAGRCRAGGRRLCKEALVIRKAGIVGDGQPVREVMLETRREHIDAGDVVVGVLAVEQIRGTPYSGSGLADEIGGSCCRDRRSHIGAAVSGSDGI